MRKNQSKDILLELLAVCFLASAGIFVRRSTLAPVNTAFWRMIIAIPFLFILAFKNLKQLNTKNLLLSLLSGVFLAGDLIFFNLSLVRTSLANTNLFTNLTAFIIAPVSYFIFKEKIPKFYFVGIAIAIIGVVILVTGKVSPTPSNYRGDLLAIGSCTFYALYFLTIYKTREKLDSNVIMFVGAFGTLFALIIACIFMEGGVQMPPTKDEFLNLFGFSIFMQVIGQNLLAYCQGKISVNLSSAITLMQPVVAAIYSVIFFKEYLSVKEIIGIAIVIVGVYICKKQYTK